jgi:hypothetical protein
MGLHAVSCTKPETATSDGDGFTGEVAPVGDLPQAAKGPTNANTVEKAVTIAAVRMPSSRPPGASDTSSALNPMPFGNSMALRRRPERNEAEGRQLARRAVIVDPENQRSVRTLSLRGGPTSLRHRSDQLASSEMLGPSGDIAADRREPTHCALVFPTRDGSTSRPFAPADSPPHHVPLAAEDSSGDVAGSVSGGAPCGVSPPQVREKRREAEACVAVCPEVTRTEALPEAVLVDRSDAANQ